MPNDEPEEPSDGHPPRDGLLLFVTGLSGAGRSVALRALEDLGFEAIDNLPLALLPTLLQRAPAPWIAVGVDVRTAGFGPEALQRAIDAAARKRSVRVLFLDCETDALVQRFSETRRRHPLARARPASAGIDEERRLLAPLRRRADTVLDTTDYTAHDLKRAIGREFRVGASDRPTVTVMSFGYARGVPRDTDMVFDMRFLRNPHWVPGLRALDGRDPRVAAYVRADPAFAPAFERIMDLLATLLPGYVREGRAYLTIAFGCTGGHHRSVAMAEAASVWLAGHGWENGLLHRDLPAAPASDRPEEAG